MLSRVTARIARPPASSRRTETAGRWFWSSVAEAPFSWLPVTTTSRFSGVGVTTPPALRSGTVIAPGSPAAIASWSTIRISSVAVRPRICLARATSCTPGSWTTMRSAPCCWITGSATPSSLTRLCSVVMFCFSALSWMSFCAAGDERGDDRQVVARAFFPQRQLAHLAADLVLGLGAGLGVAEPDLDRGRRLVDAGVADVLLAQQRADVGSQRVEPLVDGGPHVDLHQEVHASAQVEAEVHRQRMQALQPARRVRHQVQRHDVGRVVLARVERLLDRVLGGELRVRVLEPHPDRRVQADLV